VVQGSRWNEGAKGAAVLRKVAPLRIDLAAYVARGETNRERDGDQLQEDKGTPFYLKQSPLFGRLSTSELSDVCESATLEEARRRHVFFISGDPGDQVFFIATGRVKISRVTRDGKELTLAYRSAGDCFGELCLVGGGPREEMAEAMEDTTVVSIPRDAFNSMLERDGRAAYLFARSMCERRRELENKVEDLVFKDVNAKLAELLLRLSEEHGIADDHGTKVRVKITHQEMANLIGSTRETVSLTLSQFKRSGLIDNDGRKVIVTDHEGLRALI
jgi:CRP-like cAMP-binding protein